MGRVSPARSLYCPHYSTMSRYLPRRPHSAMSSQPALVGIDVGTTRIKAVAFDLDGNSLGAVHRATPWIVQERGWTQMDSGALAGAAIVAAADLTQSINGRRVLGIGVTGMAEAGVLLDASDQALSPILAWHDPRGDVETIRREIGQESFEHTVGLPLDATPSLAKILWLHKHLPETKRAVVFLSVPEWVVCSFGGRPVSELSLASRRGARGSQSTGRAGGRGNAGRNSRRS